MKSAFLLASLLSVGAAQAQIITNGSFEDPALASGTTAAYATGSTDITGWTVVGTNVQLVEKDFFRSSGYSLDASHLNQWVDLTGTNEGFGKGLTTSFSAMAGQTYTLTFDVGALGSRGKATAELFVNGTGSGYYSITPAGSGNTMEWGSFSVSFVAQANNTIKFLATGDTGGTNELVGLDNVNVTAVPEPAGFALALVALGVAGVVGKRRQG